MKKTPYLLSVCFLSLALAAPVQSFAAKANEYGLPDFSQLVEQTSPIVVNISTVKNVEPRQAPKQFRGMPEELLKHFFGMPGFKQEREQAPSEPQRRAHSLGSGFIISEDGYVLTNNHVIEDADEVIVKLSDRRELVAEVIGTDERTDVALIKVDAEDLPFAIIGDSSQIKVGQWALAIGEPFGLDFTATHGIISALGRALPTDTYVPFIQSDVPINPGNSGGPLFNLKGEVIGINSQIYSKSGGSMGLSFSIPINIAMNVAEQLKSEGKFTRGYLGVQIQEVTNDLAQSFGLDKPRGALVGQAYPNTAASRAGIESGDIILEFDGKKINESSDLPPIVGITPLDKKVDIKVMRQGKIKMFTTKLSALDEADQLANNGKMQEGGNKDENRLGAYVQTLNKDELKKLNVPFGVMVTEVYGGAAKKAGLQKGDVMVTIDFKPIKSIQDLEKIMENFPTGRSLPVRVVRNGRSLFLPLVLQK